MTEYTVYDVLKAECNLEPMVCLFCGSNEVTFDQYVEDAQCGDCGRHQIESDLNFEKRLDRFLPMTEFQKRVLRMCRGD